MRVGFVSDAEIPTWAISKDFFDAFNLGELFYDTSRERRIHDRFLIVPEQRARRVLRAARLNDDHVSALLDSAKVAQSVSLVRLKEMALAEELAILGNLYSAA